ncbi:hypothetical protein I6N98_17755 [Spongiibacter nanhainus]|uniref:Uncharacterized protein n=1 Tax=Spongiibacter nanhainus TaxID=2794344 RepID=A0A7T4UQG7_9GAMM|nr:hypothetical protein [Spongiibacter nanhainus]QQD18158.1 hypothetical protein I6N98_17755 [Spongiibacter nanhainus]
MAMHETHTTTVFGQADFGTATRASGVLNRIGLNRSEWWLNVNYAEVIEFKDAIGIDTIRARLAR